MKRQFMNPKTLGPDLIAGVVLGIESIPDAMASAILAAVNPIHGIYAVMLSTPIGAFFASSVFMSVQTTSAMSLVVASVPVVHTGENASGALMMLAILTGIMMLVLGLLKLGSAIRFVPNSVMTGFINAIAILIILGQLDNFTGYTSRGANKVFKAIDLLFHLRQVDLPTIFIGTVTILMIINLEKTRLKSLGIVVAMIFSSLLVPLFKWESVALVSDIAEIPGTLPLPTLPSLQEISYLIIPAISLAFIGLVQGAGISQKFANPDGKYPDASGDFSGQGVANIAAGIFQGMPVGGSVSATALVVGSGARSRFANIFAGVVMALVVVLLGQAVGALAMPTLAGLLIVIGFRTLKLDEIAMVWRTGTIQATVMVVTFVTALFIPLQYAVLLGIAFSVILYVFQQSNKIVLREIVWKTPTELPIEKEVPATLPPNQVVQLIPYGSLFFAAAPIFEEQLPEITPETRHSVVIINLRGHSDLGSTFLGVIQRYAESLRANECQLMLSGVGAEVRRQLRLTGLLDELGRENVFDVTEIIGESGLEAFHAAEKWVDRISST